ncbi:MAG: segregation/condensation protein A [Terracidiphilus sp.]
MEEERLPWWRRALSYALGGIRSGFGLFSRPQKETASDYPETVAHPEIVGGHDEDPEDKADLNEDSPQVEPVAEAVNVVEAVAVPEIAAAAAPEIEADIEESGEPVASCSTPAPEADQKTADAFETVAAVIATEEEPAEKTLPDEFAEESAAAIEAHDERKAEAETRDEPVDAPVAASVAEVAHENPVEIAGEGSLEHETIVDSVIGNEVLAEVPAEEEPVRETFEEPRESVEQVAGVEAEPEADAVAELAVGEETSFEEAVPELADSSVELNEPAIDQLPEEAAGQPEADEAEIQPEVGEAEIIDEAVAPVEPAPEEAIAEEAEPEAELVIEDVPEPVIEPMELNEQINEPISEHVAEPIAAGEAVPVGGAVTEAVSAEAETSVIAAESVAAGIAAEAPTEEETTAEPEQKQAAPAKPFIKLATRDNEADLSPFSVVVSEVYDGPLDLLLDLIRKQDIDIYDIPIARITAQFLAYVNQLKATDVDVAGEFIYTASLLIHIKSKMLLPRAPAGPDDAPEDPRRELVERLLEHERFKNAAQMLQQKQMLEAASWTNPGMREFKDDESAEPEIAADTVDLVRVFRDILERARNRPTINVQEDSVTVGQMIQFLARRLTMEDKPVALRRLLSHTRSERSLIAMFLALLELVRLQAILLRQDRAFSEIFIKKHTGFESVMNEGLDRARDDWR